MIEGDVMYPYCVTCKERCPASHSDENSEARIEEFLAQHPAAADHKVEPKWKSEIDADSLLQV